MLRGQVARGHHTAIDTAALFGKPLDDVGGHQHLALGLGVIELADAARTGGRLEETGRRLRDAHGAEALVLGCAGMAGYCAGLEAALGVPVVEPTRAAVVAALAAITLASETRATRSH